MSDLGRVVRFRMLIRPVASLQRSVDFYCNALGFEHVESRRKDDVDRELIVAAYGSGSLATARLRAGRQELALVEFASSDLPPAPDSGSSDPYFQHIAVITRDMARSWDKLRALTPGLKMVSTAGPQQLPRSSGNVSAVKFRDPDGHPVELLAHHAGDVPRHWQDAGHRMPDVLTLGIDHTAIGVTDTDASIMFWREVLGLELTSQQVNRGIEQERLDGVRDPVVDVVSLAPEHGTPHIELLGHRRTVQRSLGLLESSLPGVSTRPAGLHGFTVLEVDHLGALGRRWSTTMEHLIEPRSLMTEGVALAHDPDGHALLLWQPERTS